MGLPLTRCPTCNRPLADRLCPVHGYVGPASPDEKSKLSGIEKNATTDICGEIRMFGGANAPSGWLLCQGQAVSRSDYSRLYSVIGTSFGTGDGSTTFNLPNFEGKVPVGMQHDDTDFHELGHSAGVKTVTLSAEQSGLPAHHHSAIATAGAGGGATVAAWTVGGASYANNATFANTGSTTAAAAASPHTNLPPYLCINYIIRS